jgi:hypothetical protein
VSEELPPVSTTQLASSADWPPGPPGPPTRLDAFVTGGAYGVLAVAGALIGVFGSFFYQSGEIGPVPVLAIAFSLLNLGAFRLSGVAMETKLGAAVPAVAWLLVAIFLSSKRPEGDLVISSSAASYVFLIGGSIGAIAAVARTRSRRGNLPFGAPNPP